VVWCRIKSIVKALLQIGGHLSQSREYKDIYGDIVLKVRSKHLSLCHLPHVTACVSRHVPAPVHM
jgi:hypothetical protein